MGVALSAYRVIQEAITNAAKHSPGSTWRCVSTATSRDSSCRRHERPSDGPARPTSRARASASSACRSGSTVFGGTLEAGPTADGGWSVVATFPTLEAPSTSE